MNAPQHGFAEVNGASLYYEIAGSGQPLVMLHGHLLDLHQWDDQFDAFAPTHHVVRYDQRGWGQSSVPPAPFSHADDLHALLQFLGIEHAVLMGCSGGGGVCLDFALQHPAMVDALILEGSALGGFQPTGSMPPKMMAYARAMQAGELERAIELSLELFTAGNRELAQVDPVVLARTRAMTAARFARPDVAEAVPQELQPPAIERLGDIHAPTLAIVGAYDNQMIHDIAALFVARIPGARSVTVPDAGHHPNMEHPEAFNEIVAKFLEATEPRLQPK